MTCPESRHQIPEDTTTCLHCESPFEVISKNDLASPPDATTEAITTSLDGSAHVAEGQNAPRLWNPLLITAFELPVLGVVLSSVLAALNGRRLERPTPASVAWLVVCVWAGSIFIPNNTQIPLL